MHRLRHGFVARAISSNPGAGGNPLASLTSTRIPRRLAAHDTSNDYVLQGFTVTLRSEHSLAIESPSGCKLQVLGGKAWITAEGRMRDIIGDLHSIVSVEPGVRFNVSGLGGISTILVMIPGHLHDARFALVKRGGRRVLIVDSGLRPLRKTPAQWRETLARFCRRFIAAPATIEGTASC